MRRPQAGVAKARTAAPSRQTPKGARAWATGPTPRRWNPVSRAIQSSAQAATARPPIQPAMTFMLAKEATSKKFDAPAPKPMRRCSASAARSGSGLVKTPSSRASGMRTI
ncbi:hypothetical protein GALL_525360 [mine drainage metagenome]|uniref:Uncharacterized protein n=1 Tax=mine drainage metagenome TaxID=410659 RepID=A0A1J5PEF0_9ZZZZ